MAMASALTFSREPEVYMDADDFEDDMLLEKEWTKYQYAVSKTDAHAVSNSLSDKSESSSTYRKHTGECASLLKPFTPNKPRSDIPSVCSEQQLQQTLNVIPSSATQYFDWSSSPDHNAMATKVYSKRTLPWDDVRTRTTYSPSLNTLSQPSKRHQSTASALRQSLLHDAQKEVIKPALSDRLEAAANEGRKALPWETATTSIDKTKREILQQQKNDLSRQRKSSEQIRKPAVFLSQEQRQVLKLIVEGRKSVFFTGAAGTGKSVLLREIISALKSIYGRESDQVAVTASTGLAACNIGGVTLHSFAGVGLGKDTSDDLIKTIRKKAKVKSRWLRTKVLIVDEISMIDAEFFDKLEIIARSVRRTPKPFGGIQLVITGDFFQLPPVDRGSSNSQFAFEASSWKSVINHTIALHHVFRQRDEVFISMLNEMRLGKLSHTSIKHFQELASPREYADGLMPTELFPTRQEVDIANRKQLERIGGFVRIFTAVDGGMIRDADHRTRLLSNCMAPPLLQLAKDAQVMLIKNLDETLVNGSLGKIIGFMNEKTYQVWNSLSPNDDDSPFDFFLPNKSGADDQTYTESARLRKVASSKMQKAAAEEGKLFPYVRFSIPDGTTRDHLVLPEKWAIELPNGDIEAYRLQVPLILAYALSIHKAQGQTLERVRVDLSNVFEKGQAYVALSRAVSREGLQVKNFMPGKVMVHKKVSGFYASLHNA